MSDHNKHIALSITEGRTVRDLFYNGLLDYLREREYSVTVYTDAMRISTFLSQWQQAGVDFELLLPLKKNRWRKASYRWRRQLMSKKADALLKLYMAFENRYVFSPRPEYVAQFREKKTALMVSTHLYLPKESDLIHTARALGIPTLGILRSWDNAFLGLHNHTDHVAVWNQINKDEVVGFDRYQPKDVSIIGSPQFDPYFDENAVLTREAFARQLDLDPARPILVFASLGSYRDGPDETAWMDVLLDLIAQNQIKGKPQIICRLHPLSRLEQFLKYRDHPDVRLSYIDRYLPALNWYMTREDVVLIGNMLRHADVVITPASTITLEAAIFDTPTIVPIFHPYQPELAKSFFARTMTIHFKRIDRLNLTPIVRDINDFAPTINRYLEDPGWYHEQRMQLVKDYVHFTDGRSTERLADLIVEIAARRNN